MGRHAGGDGGSAGRSWTIPRVSLPLVIIVVMVVAALALGVWWWTLRHTDDPVGDSPASAPAVVVTSPLCADGDVTSVRILADGHPDGVEASISACGFIPGQRVSVQYRSDDPTVARLAATAPTGAGNALRTVLPFVILAAALIAVIAAVMLATGRRQGRRAAVGRARRQRDGAAISVAELRARMDSGGTTGDDDRRPHWDVIGHAEDAADPSAVTDGPGGKRNDGAGR